MEKVKQAFYYPLAKVLRPKHTTYRFVMRKHPHGRVPGPLEEERQRLCSRSPSLCVGRYKHPVNQSRDLERRKSKEASSVKQEISRKTDFN
jgi:hypothetical protein